MKNRIFSMLMVAVFMVTSLLSVNAVAQEARPVNNQFTKIYNKVLEMNKDRFMNLNEIGIGAVVLLPAIDSPNDTIYWVAKAPYLGKHDCIWLMTERYVAGQLETTTVDPEEQEYLLVTGPEEQANAFNWWYLLLPLIVVALILLGYLLWVKRQKNPDTYPAVGENLDGMTRQNAMTSLQRFLHPGDTLVSLHRGTLTRSYGPAKLTVRMFFGDGFYRNIWMYPGERVVTVVIENNGTIRTEHYRSACSNGFASGVIAIPNGWTIVYDEGENLVAPVSEDEAPNPPEPIIPAPAPIVPTTSPTQNLSPVTSLDAEGIAKIIGAAEVFSNISIDIFHNGDIKIVIKDKPEDIQN